MIKQAARLPAHALVATICLYQRTLAPFMPALFGPGCGCRFTPSCSHYAAEAIHQRGLIVGGGLALRRLAKCNPFHPGGPDPVPPARPRCVRLTA